MNKAAIFIVALVLVRANRLIAQSVDNDLLSLSTPTNKPHIRSLDKKRSWNPLSIGYQTGIKFYQKVISEQLATSCAFELTCSRFSSAMVKEHGFLKGYFLTFDRLSRCSRIATVETYPIRLNQQNKIIEAPADFHFHQ
jgi:putative component of membrane protein insertase Oxa1/YidC/SpoIIIJ protein YidD